MPESDQYVLGYPAGGARAVATTGGSWLFDSDNERGARVVEIGCGPHGCSISSRSGSARQGPSWRVEPNAEAAALARKLISQERF